VAVEEGELDCRAVDQDADVDFSNAPETETAEKIEMGSN
jgi:hypothetical protein